MVQAMTLSEPITQPSTDCLAALALPLVADSAMLGGATDATLRGATLLQTHFLSTPIRGTSLRIQTLIAGSTACMTICLLMSTTGGDGRALCGLITVTFADAEGWSVVDL
ncbi:hypothetical protein QC763_117675 [Podospora pseudopauciseta]|uniref:Uncharacterized protein n=1 Tax=Podospora pseudopauciseta TaxID=2093780 RepID=A0ABR0I175_9PEZI|nr:hypothetical protein QC763_117675 [Podospora pseudopauciseta]